MPHFSFQPDASLLRRMSARLGEGFCLSEPEAPKLPIFALPWQRPLRLGKPEVLILFLSSVYSRNHQLE